MKPGRCLFKTGRHLLKQADTCFKQESLYFCFLAIKQKQICPNQPQYNIFMVFLRPTNLRLGKNHSGQDKAHMYVRDILIIKNFANCHNWLFFNKYTHEHIFSVFWVREATLRNKMYMYFNTICMSDS